MLSATMSGWAERIRRWLGEVEQHWLAGDGAIGCESHSLEADPPSAWCAWCGASVARGERREPCLGCLGMRRLHNRVVRLAELGGDWRASLLRIKYGCDAIGAESLGIRLAEQHRLCGVRFGVSNVVVVPIPAAPLREWHRGIDPVGEIARSFARTIAAPIVRPLRHAGGPPRTGQSRPERRRRRLACRWGWTGTALAGLRVILVDDVLTTGATIREAARLVRRLGANEVEVGVVAVTPTPGREGCHKMSA